MNQKLRKAFVSSVMFTMVFALSGVATVNPVSAAASAGDLIKMKGLDTIYYLGADGKRYVFPNAQTYFSWYPDFSTVITVPQSELESYRLGANVTMRAATKLVKITTDPTVYAVEPNGTLKSIVSEANAKALFGDAWAKRVIDVADAFFTNYSVKTPLEVGKYPVGSVVQSGTNKFYYDGTNYRQIASDAAFSANRFQTANVVSTTATITASGTALAGAEAALINTGAGAATVGVTPGAGTGLSVALAATTPASGTVLADSTSADGAQALISVATVNFVAAADGAVQVNKVNFKRAGVPSTDTDFAEFYLYDGKTLLAKYSSISSGVLTFSNGSGLFTVPAGTTKAVTLKVNLAVGTSASKAFNFGILSAADVTTNGAAVSGSFPITGNTMSTAQVSDLGKLTVATSTSPSAPNPGAVAHSLQKFTLAAVDQNVQVESIKLTIIGTVDAADIANFKLDVGGTQVGSTVAAMASDKTVTFDLSAAPYAIAKGNTKTLTLTGDVKSGTSRTFQVYIYNKEDVVAKDTEYGVYITPNQANTWTRLSGTAATIASGSLTIAKATTSPTGNVPAGATGVEIGRFDLAAAGEAIKIDTVYMYVDIATTTTSIGGLYQVKMYVDGTQVGTAQNLSEITATAISLGNTLVIPAGTTKTLVVKADMKTSGGTTFATGDVIAFQLGNSSSVAYTKQSSGGTGTSGAVSANSLTARTGTVSVAKNTSFGSKSSTTPTGTVNATGVKIASFVITGGSGEAVNVSQITLADITTALGNNFQNLKLKHGEGTSAVQIGNTVSSPNTTVGTYDFSANPLITIASGEQYVVDVYADIKGSPQDSASLLSPVLNTGAITATGVTTTTDASYSTAVGLQAAYIASTGTLTVTLDADTTLSDQLVMGSTDQELAKFKFTAGTSENVNISELIISDSVSAAATGTIKNLSLYDGATKIAGPIQIGSSATSTYALATFSGLSLSIAAGQNKVLTVKGDVSLSTDGATSGSTHAISILQYTDAATTRTMTAKGASSGSTITPTVATILAGNSMTAYKTKITASWASDTPTGASSGSSAQTIAKINVTNSANAGSYSATVSAMNFVISSTIVTAASTHALTVYKDAVGGTALATTNYAASQVFSGTSALPAFTTATEIAAGATKLFIVTLNTSDAASTKNLSVYVDTTGITWTDGTTSNTNVKSLPLVPKTLTY